MFPWSFTASHICFLLCIACLCSVDVMTIHAYFHVHWKLISKQFHIYKVFTILWECYNSLSTHIICIALEPGRNINFLRNVNFLKEIKLNKLLKKYSLVTFLRETNNVLKKVCPAPRFICLNASQFERTALNCSEALHEISVSN